MNSADQHFEKYMMEYIPRLELPLGPYPCNLEAVRYAWKHSPESIKHHFDNIKGEFLQVGDMGPLVRLDNQGIANCFQQSVLPAIKNMVTERVKNIKSVTNQAAQRPPKIVRI